MSIDDSMGELLKAVSKSKRNIFTVLHENEELIGLDLLANISEVLLQREK